MVLTKPTDFGAIEKEETTLEALKSSTDWEQAIILFTEDSYVEPLFEETRAYLFFREAGYFNSELEHNNLPAVNLDFTFYTTVLESYINGTNPTQLKIEKVYKVKSLFDRAFVEKRMLDLTVVDTDIDDIVDEEVVDE